MATFGNVLLGLALLGCLVAIGAFVVGHRAGRKEGESATNLGYLSTTAVFGILSVATLMLSLAFFTKNYSLLYVVENHSTDVSSLSWLYTLSALWAGREGSLLFWAWLISVFAGYIAFRRKDEAKPIDNMGLLVTMVVLALFIVGLLFDEPNNPFKMTPAGMVGADGVLQTSAAMNPLLQHWAMILHPPTLFIGYAGMTIAFAYAISAIINNDGSDAWVRAVDRITVFSWLFLGAGIGLGSVWAYVVLGWGGYWAWDPVENASLLPWLTGVGLLHSFTVYRRRNGFKRWAIVMASVSFALVILGTFITRSGVVQSVHAFQQDPFSLYLFLGMILAAIIAGVGGVLWRGDTFTGKDDFESLTSKEAAYYFNNVLMLIAALLVAYLTVSSALPKWLPGGGQSFTTVTYDAVGRPVGILYLMILAICPLLSWGKTEGLTLWQRLRWPLLGTLVLSAPLIYFWQSSLLPIYNRTMNLSGDAAKKLAQLGPSAYYNGLGAIGIVVGVLVVCTAVWLFIDSSRKRAAASGTSFVASLGSILGRARTTSGGYITHIGMGIILIGLVGSAMYVDDYVIRIPDEPGQTFEARDYTFTYRGVETNNIPNGDVETTLVLDVAKDGKPVGTATPGQLQYFQQQQTRLNVDVISEPLRDIFVVFQGGEEGQLVINVKINPLIWFAWIGFAILMAGTTLAAWPKKTVLREVPAAPARSGKAKTAK